MITFLIFLFWIAFFCSPLLFNLYKYFAKRAEIGAKKWTKLTLWAIGGAVLIRIVLWALHLWTDVLWFQELGYVDRFWTVFKTKWFLFFFGSIITWIFLAVNIRVAKITELLSTKKAGKEKAKDEAGNANESEASGVENYLRGIRIAAYVAAGVISLGFGSWFSSHWETLLVWKNQVSFGITDPIFQKDAAFYVFTLPFISFVRNVLFAGIVAAVALTASYYAGQWNIYRRHMSPRYRFESSQDESFADTKKRIKQKVIVHGSILTAALMIKETISTRITSWSFLFSDHGVFSGAGYTNVNVEIAAYWVFMVSLIITAFAILVAARLKSDKAKAWVSGGGIAFNVVVWLIGIVIIPALYQHFNVSPNQQDKEAQYIKYNIDFTRQAYGLTDDKIQRVDYPVDTDVTSKVFLEDKVTLDNIRLWDYRVLQSASYQYQAFRLYYMFPAVDVVRYLINGKLTQLMYSARELDSNRLVENAKTWQNLHLFYTHGFGAVANPVTTFTAEGAPDYWIKNVPPVAKFPELQIKQPRIYFGESTFEHVYVKTTHPEFDYPEGEQNHSSTYDGTGGIEVGSGLRKLAFALRFDGIRLLTASEITEKSRIMFRRDIETRVKVLAPFLGYDRDPYQIVANGELWYILDAFTTTNMYPYSHPYNDNINYIRNSVKVVVNAYSGKVDFYVFDEKDPLIQTYAKIFPNMLKPASAMPSEIRKHVRYSEDMLDIQGSIYSIYHMNDPKVFFGKEDAWKVARENSHGETREIEPYYVIMKLPQEKKEEFILMLPFSPYTTDPKHPRDNMVGWLAAKCDGENYGKLLLYSFSKDKLVNGPLQISMRVNQDENISKDFTLWNQQGSSVITGNLLVIPIAKNQLLYVQPVYLQSSVGKMPELKRVIVASNDKVGYATTFEAALRQLISEIAAEPAPIGEKATKKTITTDKESLIRDIAGHFEMYRKLTGQGKLSEAGHEMEKLGNKVQQLLKK